MEGWVAVTHNDWFDVLAREPRREEVNFWSPSAEHAVNAEPFSPFLFKLKAPHNAICGFGFYAGYSRLPDWLAWDCFGLGNGCSDLQALRERLGELREGIRFRGSIPPTTIGCVLITQPTFFAASDWIPQPTNWPKTSVRATAFDLGVGEGKRVWDACLERSGVLPVRMTADGPDPLVSDPSARYGKPHVVEPRLGQGTFRVAVTDAYERACVVTDEHSLPALDAAHIRPFAEDGPHDVSNGLLLRADIHRLFDQGYVTVTPDLVFRVSERLKTDYQNGRSYYPLDAKPIRRPGNPGHLPSRNFLEWHSQSRFLR